MSDLSSIHQSAQLIPYQRKFFGRSRSIYSDTAFNGNFAVMRSITSFLAGLVGALASTTVCPVGASLANANDVPPNNSATPRGNPDWWFSETDYPAEASGATVSVRYVLDVGFDGRASNCRIEISSGIPEIDKKVCDTVSRRARFSPYVDENGKIQKGIFSRSITLNISQSMNDGSVIAKNSSNAAITESAIDPQKQCDSYVGKIITPITFDQAVASLNIPKPKGEFETTAAYQARIVGAGATTPLIIGKQPESADYLEYDADRQAFAVKSFFFHNAILPAWETFYHAKNGVEAHATYSPFSNIHVVVSDIETATGSYLAQNGFGAKARVTNTTRTIKAVFERKSTDYKEDLFNSDDSEIGYVSVPISKAQAFKKQARSAFVVVIKEPYLTRASFAYGDVTINNPTDVRIDATVLHADIQCALLTDGSNKVLTAFATR